MSRTTRTVAKAAALAVGATALALPLAAPVHATGPVETAVVLADKNGDGYFGLYTMTTPTGPETPLPNAGENDHTDYYDVSVSGDGQRVAYRQEVFPSAAATEPTSEQILVQDISGRVVRTVVSVSPRSATAFAPALSPDGTSVVWSYGSAAGLTLERTDVGTGVTTKVGTGLADPAFLNATTLLAFDTAARTWVAIGTDGTGKTAVSGLPAAVGEVHVSPADPTQLVWTLDKTASGTTTAVRDVQVGTLDLAAHAVESVTTVATGADNHSPSYSRSGKAVYYVHDNGTPGTSTTPPGSGDIYSVALPYSAPGAAVGPTPGVDEQEVAVGTMDDTTDPAAAPGAVTARPADLGSSNAILRWTNPTDADLSGVVVSRTGRSVYVPAPVTSLNDTGLTAGTTYAYTITPVDRSGIAGPSAGLTVVPLRTTPAFVTPTSGSSTKAAFPIAWTSAQVPAGATFDVSYAANGSATWTPWLTGTHAASATFTKAVPGSTYRFKVLGHDGHGNTGVSVSGVAVVPFDQTKAAFSGGTTISTTRAYLGSVRQLRTRAAYARVSFTGRTFRIVGVRCAGCGKLAVYEGSRLLGTADTYASSARWRVVVFTKTYAASGTHTLVIRSLATPGRPAVDIDGFAISK